MKCPKCGNAEGVYSTMNEAEINKMFESHKEALTVWLEEAQGYQERKKTMDDFIEQHQLPEDITVGELLEYCKRNSL